MQPLLRAIVVLLLAISPSLAFAGNIYTIAVEHGGETKRFTVQIGGGERTEVWTAFDPAQKRFVHLKFARGAAEPKPAGEIWDSRTGATIKLYTFEKSLLPRIEKIEDLKVCPFTGSTKLSIEEIIAID